MQIVDGWVDVAEEVDVLDNSMSRNGYKPTHIVLHSTAGGSSAENIGAYFQSTVSGSNPVSSHFVIGQDGTIVQCVSCDVAAWANGALIKPRFAFPAGVNPNLYTISIEHVKPSTDNSDALTAAQAQASFQLIQLLCDTYGIPKQAGDARSGIISHADLDSVNRARCPGPYPWDALWAFLKGGSIVNVPQGWKDDGTTLTAPNGLVVKNGFRDYVLGHQWDPLNLPLELEHAQSPLEISNSALGNGTQQVFRWDVLEWTPSRGVFLAWSGQELLAYRVQLANALKAIVALQQQVQVLQDGSQVNDLKTRLQQIKSLASI